MTPHELNAGLVVRCAQVAEMLLPGGRSIGGEWTCAGIGGDVGKSCKLRLSGDKAGKWSDFATGESGDLLDLWSASRGIKLSEAMKQAADWLGLKPVEFEQKASRQWARPRPLPDSRPDDDFARRYLNGRGISDEVLDLYRVALTDRGMVFPFLRDGVLVMAKSREAVAGVKPKPTDSGCEKCLFGWQAIADDARTVLICEGEIDALSAYEMGVPAMSVPYGAGGGNKQDWIEGEFHHLDRFDEIFLCMDRDKPGDEAVAEIVRRLGAHRCRIVEIPAPHKDINDLLMAGWNSRRFSELVHQSRSLDPDELRPLAAHHASVVREFYPESDTIAGFCTPWPKADTKLRFRLGELIVLAGTNGHGKTLIAANITLKAMKSGLRCCVASLELQARRWLYRLYRQAAGNPTPPAEYLQSITDWGDERLWVFDAGGHTDAARMLEVFDYAVRRYRIQFFVIDNLTRCGFADDDYSGQKRFIEQLCDFCALHNTAVLLVAHVRKGQDESHAGGKLDIKGSGTITDLADTVLNIWRNKRKEDLLNTDPEDLEALESPDAILKCDKQRNGDDEPKYSLWFDKASMQFVESRHARAMRVVDYSNVVEFNP